MSANASKPQTIEPVDHIYDDNVVTYLFPDFIPLDEILWDQKTLVTKNNSICQLIRLSGIDVQGLSKEEIDKLHNMRRAFFANDALDKDVCLAFHSRRKKEQFKKTSFSYEDELAHKVAEEHLEQFVDGFVTELSIVVTIPLGNLIRKKIGIPSKQFSEENFHLRKKVQDLGHAVEHVSSLLQDFDPYVVSHSEDGESELLEFWMEMSNGGKTITTPHGEQNVDLHVSFSDVEFFPKQKFIKFTDSQNEQRYAAFLGLNAYPSQTFEGILDSILSIDHDLNVMHYFLPQHIEETKIKIDKSIRMLSNIQGFTRARYEDLEQAATYVNSEELNFHGHVISICVYGDSKDDLEKGINQIYKSLAPAGISLIRESWNLHGCFFGQFPDGQRYLKARRTMITPDNLAQLISLTGAHEGHRHCAFGHDSVVPFKRPDGTIYHFNWHPTPSPDVAGHTFLCGGTGSGKTMLAMFLTVMSLKFKGLSGDRPLKALLFDSGKGAKIPTLAFGGSYHTLKEDSTVGLNPFSMNETISNKDFLFHFIKMLAGNHVSKRQEQTISEIIRQNYQLPEDKRKLYELRDLFGQSGGIEEDGSPTLATLLDAWLPDEDNPKFSDSPNGLMFNAEYDSLDFDSQMVGFDMSLALKDKDLLAPLTAYIFHRFDRKIASNPCPHLIFVDEVAQYLEHPIFGDYILKILREQRKKGGAMVIAGQEPTVLTGSDNGRAALENIETFVIWQNNSARPQDYMEDGLGLTDREFEWVKNPKGKREVMVKRKNGGSVILNIDLSHLGQHFHLFQSRSTCVEMAEELMASEENHWVNQYMERAHA